MLVAADSPSAMTVNAKWNTKEAETLRKATYEGLAQYRLLTKPDNVRHLAVLEYAIQRLRDNPALKKDDLVKEIKLGQKQLDKIGFVAGSKYYTNFEDDANLAYEAIGDALKLAPGFTGKKYAEVGYKWLVRGLNEYTSSLKPDPNVMWQNNSERLAVMSSGIIDDAYKLAQTNPEFAAVLHVQFKDLFPAVISPGSTPDSIRDVAPDYADHINIQAIKEALATDKGVDEAFIRGQFQRVLGNLDAINKDNTKYLRDIKGMILEQNARAWEQEERQRKAEEYQLKIDGARAACNILGTLAGWTGNAKLARTISIGGNAIVTMVDSVNKIAKVAKAANDLNKVMNIVTNLGSVVGAIGGIVSLFNSGPSEFEMVSQQIGAMHKDMMEGFGKLSQQIGKMHEDMIKGFQGLSDQMAEFEKNMMAQFKWVQESFMFVNKRLETVIDLSLLQLDRLGRLSADAALMKAQLNAIQKDLNTIGNDVARIHYYLVKGFQDQTENLIKLNPDLQLCLTEKGIMEREAQTVTQQDFNKCVSPLANMALDVVKNNTVFSVPFEKTDLENRAAEATFKRFSPFENMTASLSYFMGQDTPVAVNNVLAWARSVNVYLDLHDMWPKYSVKMKKGELNKHLDAMIQDGENVEANLRSAYIMLSEEGDFVPNRMVFGRFLDEYHNAVQTLMAKLDDAFLLYCKSQGYAITGVKLSEWLKDSDSVADAWVKANAKPVGPYYEQKIVGRALFEHLAYEFVTNHVVPEATRPGGDLASALKEINGIKAALHAYMRMGLHNSAGPVSLYSGDDMVSLTFIKFAGAKRVYFDGHPLKTVSIADLIKGLSDPAQVKAWGTSSYDYLRNKTSFRVAEFDYLTKNGYRGELERIFDAAFALLDADCKRLQKGQATHYFRVPTYLRLTNKRLRMFKELRG